MTPQFALAPEVPHLRHGGVVALVPRINIHAFCANPVTAEAMQVAAGDRRLARAHLDIKPGGLKAAVQLYGETPSPLSAPRAASARAPSPIMSAGCSRAG